MKKYITILSFYMPDGRKYKNGEIVTFENDSFRDFLLYEGYILEDINDIWFRTINITNYHKKILESYTKEQLIQTFKSVENSYKKYFKLYQESIYRDVILMKDIINSISIWEFIQQKYFNSNKSIRIK